MCIVNTDKVFCLLGSVILIKISDIFISKYILNAMKSPYLQEILSRLCGSIAQQAIYLRDIKNVPIPLLSIEEQTQIVQEIETRLPVADMLDQIIEESLQKAEALRQSILKKAFEGRLVPQDPNDEPAEKLLERIKVERENTKQFKNKIKDKNDYH